MADKIQNAYHASKNIYDTVLTQGNVFSRLYIKLFWGGTDDVAVANRLLSWVPDDFAGKLLDVPVGTAVFTEEKWKRLSQAHITCLDYSQDMLDQARTRLGDQTHIQLVQGDVGKLPMPDAAFDLVLSMNGFHAFPDKEKAFQETWRVLKPGGSFLACFYIRGESAVTDWLVRRILSRKGWFTPPFQTRQELQALLETMYRSVELVTDGSLVSFRCVK